MAISTSDRGTSWTETAPGGSFLLGVSCLSTTFCESAGTALQNSPLGGVVEKSVNGGLNSGRHGDAGRRNAECDLLYQHRNVLGGRVRHPGIPAIARTLDGGAVWNVETGGTVGTTGANLESVACPMTEQCWAVGGGDGLGALVTTTNSGKTWSAVPIPALITNLSGVACGGPTTCFAVGYSSSTGPVVLATTNGLTWTSQSVPAPTAGLEGITCRDATHCWAVGYSANFPSDDGTVLTTDNGGQEWTVQATFDSVTEVRSITCVTRSSCLATTTDQVSTGPGTPGIMATTDGGASWSPESASGHPAALLATACLTAKVCWVVGYGGTTQNHGTLLDTSNGGTAWTREWISGEGVLAGVSCLRQSKCWAVGNTTSSAAVVLATR